MLDIVVYIAVGVAMFLANKFWSGFTRRLKIGIVLVFSIFISQELLEIAHNFGWVGEEVSKIIELYYTIISPALLVVIVLLFFTKSNKKKP